MIGCLVFLGVHFIIQYKSSSDWILRYKVGTLIAYVIRVYVDICLATNKGSWLGFGVDFIFNFEIHASALESEPNSGIRASLLGLHSYDMLCKYMMSSLSKYRGE